VIRERLLGIPSDSDIADGEIIDCSWEAQALSSHAGAPRWKKTIGNAIPAAAIIDHPLVSAMQRLNANSIRATLPSFKTPCSDSIFSIIAELNQLIYGYILSRLDRVS
jgi:hypothetical protein